MFKGITAFECSACEIPHPIDIPLIQEPTKEIWNKLHNIMSKRENLCKVCSEAINVSN